MQKQQWGLLQTLQADKKHSDTGPLHIVLGHHPLQNLVYLYQVKTLILFLTCCLNNKNKTIKNKTFYNLIKKKSYHLYNMNVS